MTDKPITHLLYSHSHADCASGGAVIADGATVIAQANAPDIIDGVKPSIRFDDYHEFKEVLAGMESGKSTEQLTTDKNGRP